jgi:hypothetical protein
LGCAQLGSRGSILGPGDIAAGSAEDFEAKNGIFALKKV